MFDINSILVASLICCPAFFLAANRSTFLVDYLFFVVSLNRCVRRIVDYYNGQFNPFSLISLTPIIVGGLATLVVLVELNYRKEQFGGRAVRTILPYGIAVILAFFVGFINARFAAVYALGNYIAPIGLLGYGALYANNDQVISRWCNSVACTALLVAVYGVWQFYTIPPWDAFWLVQAGMDGYMGIPKPQKMTLFSTMNERGPAAAYLCGGLTLLLLRPATLGILRWPAVFIVTTAMLFTYSRTSVIQAISAVVLYPLLGRKKSFIPSALILGFIVIVGPKLLGSLPASDQAAKRVATLGNIQDDGSFKARLTLLRIGIQGAITQPFGIGIGSHGSTASRVSRAMAEGTGDSTGYVMTLRTFGWIGFVLVGTMIFRIWIAARDLTSLDLDDVNVTLFRAWFISGAIAFFSGDWLFTATFFWILAGYCLGRMDLWEKQSSDLAYFGVKDESLA